jgi:uncharacterized protein
MKPFSEVYNCDSITINVTNKCNLSCTYCFEKGKNDVFMSVEDALKIVDMSYTELEGDKRFMVNIFGGEPFLNWEVIEAVCNHIREQNYKARVGITTNLTILTDHMIDVIEDHEVYLLTSIDGVKEVHDKHRCDSYDVVVNNLQRLIKRKLFYLIETRMTVSPDTVQHLFTGVQSLFNMGINNICSCLVTDQEWTEEQLNTLKDQTEQVLDFYFNVLNDVNNKRNLSMKLVDDYLVASLEPNVIIDKNMCAVGTNRWCAISPTGDVYGCHQQITDPKLGESEKIGNIFEGVDENKVVEVPQAKFDRPECRDCVAISMCKSGCPSQNMIENCDFHTPTKAYCDTSRVLAKLIKEKREILMNAENIRSRKLNKLKINLQMKKYFDDVLCTTDINSPDFPIVMQKFMNYLDDNKDVLMYSFEMYFTKKLIPLFTLIGGDLGGK